MKTFFEASIWPLRNKLFRMAYLWLKNRDEAEDAVQEALEKAWSNREMLQKSENPTGWLVRVVKNQSLQKIREHKRWVVLGEEEELPDLSEPSPPEQTASMKMVFAFLKELPEKQQEIFHLREVEGLTYEEISEYLDISLELVKVSLFRARKSLRLFLLKRKQ
jgi:RNA polymerase sigma-70 factor (ECF subfamily)